MNTAGDTTETAEHRRHGGDRCGWNETTNTCDLCGVERFECPSCDGRGYCQLDCPGEKRLLARIHRMEVLPCGCEYNRGDEYIETRCAQHPSEDDESIPPAARS